MSKTPPSVRVARWAAVAAAITGLFTVGNTFIEKRPWFLGGDEEKPTVVVPAPVPIKKVAHYEEPAAIHFSIPSTNGEMKSTTVSEASVMSAMSSEIPPASMMVMSSAPDMGWWGNFLNFMYYRPIPFWTITISLFFIGVFCVTELLHHRKKGKDKTRWTVENPDIQKPLP